MLGRSHTLVLNPSVLEKGHNNVANTEGHPVLGHKKRLSATPGAHQPIRVGAGPE